MDLTFLLCFIFASPVFGDDFYSQNTNPLVELDRARSAWIFGGHPMRNRQWVRPKNTAGSGPVIANRRTGERMGAGMRTNAWNLPSSASRRKPTSPSSSSIRSRQSNPNQKSKPKPQKPYNKFLKSNNNRNPSSPMGYQNYPRPSMLPRPPFNSQNDGSQNKKSKNSGLPMTMSSSMRNTNNYDMHRGSRMMESRSDNFLNRFRKEDLWHLDKGEGYEVKNEDLIIDSMLRNPYSFELSNEIYEDLRSEKEQGHEHHSHEEEKDKEHHENEAHNLEHEHKQKLESEAENMINEAEKNGEKFHSESMAKQNHVHHHHHYDGAMKAAAAKANTTKKEDPNKVIPAPLPRIHLPIPLGCLLAVPAFHPIRPRHHLTCLLSIPGTPNLMKRRRKRSADQQLKPIWRVN